MQTSKKQQIANVAKLYYTQNMKQSDIAEKMGVARSTISMLLTQARELGIVKIDVCDPFKIEQTYTEDFNKKFGVGKCYTVKTSLKETDSVMDLIFNRAGEIFDSMLKDNLTIGLAWGNSCYKFISQYSGNKHYRNIEVVPLLGGMDLSCYIYQQNEMIRQFAEKIGGHVNYIYAPLIADSKEERDMYMNSSSMQQLREKWKKIDISILGVGNEPRYNKIFRGEPLDYAEDLRLCGDLCGLFFDEDGCFPENEFNAKTVGISSEMLKNIPEVIAISGGAFKKRSILGALKSRVIKTFITDEDTAASLV